MVPLGADASRHTTLGLLTKAKRFIKVSKNFPQYRQTWKKKKSWCSYKKLCAGFSYKSVGQS